MGSAAERWSIGLARAGKVIDGAGRCRKVIDGTRAGMVVGCALPSRHRPALLPARQGCV